MTGRCTGCGDCCAVVTVAKEMWERITAPRMEATVDHEIGFILKNWHEVTPEQAAAVAPYNGAQMWVDFWKGTADRQALLRCDAFDYEKRQCTAYEDRPSVCKGFPWYGDAKPTNGPLWRLFRCGYWADLPRDEWPEWVDVVELAKQGIQ